MTGQQRGMWGYSIAVTSRASGQPLSNKILAVSIDLSSSLLCSLPKGLTIVSPALFQFFLPSICLPGHLLIHSTYIFSCLPLFASASGGGFYKLPTRWTLNFKLSAIVCWFTESWATLKAADHRFLGQVVRGSPFPVSCQEDRLTC